MDEKPNSLHLALDDLRLIRQVLDRTADSFRALAPSFFRMGLVWLVYALLYTLAVAPDTLNYLFPSLHLKGLGAYFGLIQWLQLPLALYLVAECVLWQRKKPAYAALSRQIVGVWQVLLLLYLVLLALFQLAVSAMHTEVILEGTAAMQQMKNLAICGAFLAFLPAIFPGFPLVATGVLLGEKALGWLGAAVTLLGVLAVLGTLGNTGNPSPLLVYLLTIVWLLSAFFQPAALLLTAFRLRRRREGPPPAAEES